MHLMPTFLHYIIASFLLFYTCAVSSEPSNHLSLISRCVCLGYNVTYNCTVFGGGNTIWNGTAFNCPSNSDSNNNQILLRHSGFGAQGSSRGICNGGAIVGVGISAIDNVFNSQLNVMVSPDVVGKNVACYHENGTSENLVGNVSISVNIGSKLY